MKIVECPRDAMQGIKEFIPTSSKVNYINQLLKVGFDTIDFGSFVSPKAIPQMRDTAEVLDALHIHNSKTKLLAIVANIRGAEEASAYDAIHYLGFPLSISEGFQKRNTNASIPDALNTLESIKNICIKSNKQLVTYISMGFGNPYGDPYSIDLVENFMDVILTVGSDVISLADTIGISNPENIKHLFKTLSHAYPTKEIGVHLHATPGSVDEKIRAAYEAGCRRFDGALKGLGGCPMAKDDLVGNLPTENIISFLEECGVDTGINKVELHASLKMAAEIFPFH